jgi:hypothetical protein
MKKEKSQNTDRVNRLSRRLAEIDAVMAMLDNLIELLMDDFCRQGDDGAEAGKDSLLTDAELEEMLRRHYRKRREQSQSVTA